MAVDIGEPHIPLCDDDHKKEDKRAHCMFRCLPERTPKFTNHETKSVKEYLSDLQNFIEKRLGPDVKLAVPQIYNPQIESKDELVEKLRREGFQSCDWLSRRLTHQEVEEAIQEMALLHAGGLAYRTSMKKGLEESYPWLEQDIYTSYQTKELLAKYLDSYLHYLSSLPGLENTVFVLRKFKSRIFHLLVTLRRPIDSLGRRFRTVCHGDLWMGSLMFRQGKEKLECAIIDFHSTGYMSPASDLAHLMLTSTDRRYMVNNWEQLVETYYSAFSYNLANLGLVLRHLGTSKNHFHQEVRRALAGEVLCLAVVTPILVMCGPKEKGRCRRPRNNSDRENTVRHLIQMMAIEEETEEEEQEVEGAARGGGKVFSASHSEEEEDGDMIDHMSKEWRALHKDQRLRSSVVDLLLTAQELGIMAEFSTWAMVDGMPKRRRTNTI